MNTADNWVVGMQIKMYLSAGYIFFDGNNNIRTPVALK